MAEKSGPFSIDEVRPNRKKPPDEDNMATIKEYNASGIMPGTMINTPYASPRDTKKDMIHPKPEFQNDKGVLLTLNFGGKPTDE